MRYDCLQLEWSEVLRYQPSLKERVQERELNRVAQSGQSADSFGTVGCDNPTMHTHPCNFYSTFAERLTVKMLYPRPAGLADETDITVKGLEIVKSAEGVP
jgi:hypothetical protein